MKCLLLARLLLSDVVTQNRAGEIGVAEEGLVLVGAAAGLVLSFLPPSSDRVFPQISERQSYNETGYSLPASSVRDRGETNRARKIATDF